MFLPQRIERGITLLELLVSLALSSLVFVLIAGLYLFANKTLFAFQERSFFNDERVLFESEIMRHTKDIELITEADREKLSFSTFPGSPVSLEYSPSKNLLLNGRPLLPEGFRIDKLDFKFFAVRGSGESSELIEPVDKNGNFRLDERELAPVSLIEMSYILSHKKISKDLRLEFLLNSKQ